MLINPNLQERFHDYLLQIDVPAAGIRDVSLQMDTDSSFSLRSWKVLNVGSDGAAKVGVRFRNENGTFVHQGFISPEVYPVRPGAASYPTMRGMIQNPELIYSAQSTIRVDFANYTGSALSNVQVLFRGAKYFGGRGPASYPVNMSAFPFVQVMTISNLSVTGSSVQNAVFVEQEADYVFRGGVCDPGFLAYDGGPVRGGAIFGSNSGINPASGQYSNITAQLMDGDLKPYSNVPIPLQELFPQANPYPSVANGGAVDPSLWRVGLFTPQIYVPRLQGLFLSVFRNDAAALGDTTLNLRFHGAKVYAL